MPIDVVCPNAECGRKTAVPDAAAGRRVRCPGCQSSVLVPATESLPGRSGTASGKNQSTTPNARTSGDSVGRFVVRSKLGAGAFGTVYRAFDPQLQREVALKVPNAGVLDSPKRVERFLREARAAANLTHPHIVPVFDAGKDADRYYIASAFIDGNSLADTIPDGGTEYRRAATLARELAEALAYAHGQGVVHRDVKPANCLVDRADGLHLADFGLAAKSDDSSEAKLTNDGAVLGTPAYMAPEQAAGQKGEARPGSDQYAVGVVLYELLTGRTPFSGPPAVVLYNVLNTEPERPSAVRPDIPRDLETVCAKAMAKRPEDRYPGCQALADDLRRWLDDEPISARRLSRTERVVRWVRKNPAAAGVGGLTASLVGLAAVTAVVVFFWQEAVAEKGIAEQATIIAERESASAILARTEAETARADLAVARDRLARADYGNTIQLAYQSFVDNDLATATRLTGKTDPSLRGWEWQFLDHHCNGGGGELRRFDHDRAISCADLSADGTRLLTTVGTTARLWDTTTGDVVRTLTAQGKRISAAAIAPDGGRVVTGSDNGIVEVWDANTGAVLHTLTGHGKFAVLCAAFHPTGTQFITGGRNRTAITWDAATGQPIHKPDALRGDVAAAAYSRDGSRFAIGGRVSGGQTGFVALRETASGRVIVTTKADINEVTSIAFGSDSGELLAGYDDGVTREMNLAGRSRMFGGNNSRRLPRPVADSRYSPDGGRVVATAEDNTAVVWDRATGEELARVRGHTAPVILATFTPDGSKLVTASQDGTARLWELTAAADRVRVPHGIRVIDRLYASTICPDGTTVAAGMIGETKDVLFPVVTFDAVTGERTAEWKGHDSLVRALEYSRDGNALVTGGDDNAAIIWNVADGTVRHTLRGHTMSVYDVSFSPDATRVATASWDGRARIWDATTGACLHTLPGHSGPAAAIAFSPDGREVVRGGFQGEAAVWDATTGAKRLTLTPERPNDQPNPVLAVGYSPDGTRIVTGHWDKSVNVWDSRTGGLVMTLLGHAGPVNAVGYHPTGDRIVTGGGDLRVKVWDAKYGTELLTIGDHSDWVQNIQFSDNGAKLLTGGGDRLVGKGLAFVYTARPVKP